MPGLGAAAAWPLVARAQLPANMPRIGVLSPGTSEPQGLAALYDGLHDRGYTEGQNIVNLKTTRGLRLTIDWQFLLLADGFIE